jgi:hypothetical protein
LNPTVLQALSGVEKTFDTPHYRKKKCSIQTLYIWPNCGNYQASALKCGDLNFWNRNQCAKNNNVTDPIPVLVFIGDQIKISPNAGYWDCPIPIYWRTEIT